MDESLVEWLLENSGPVIRYRTTVELLKNPSSMDLESLERNLLASPEVQTWLKRLEPEHIHSSKNTALENVIGKLIELGFRAGMPAFDQRMLQLCRWLPTNPEKYPGNSPFEKFGASILAAGFTRAGYGTKKELRTFLSNRLNNLHRAARKRIYDVYLDEDALADLPKAWCGKLIIKHEHSPLSDDHPLPTIHDIYALSHFPSDMMVAGKATEKINDIIDYILSPDFQSLPFGYGHLFEPQKRRYYAMGWSPHLPAYGGLHFENALYEAMFVQRLELMAHFQVAHRSQWFLDSIQYLEQYRNKQGIYCLPACFLREQKNGYYVTGAYMGLGENRRKKRGREIESTFRMLKIQSSMK